jgi:hypothetical protein
VSQNRNVFMFQKNVHLLEKNMVPNKYSYIPKTMFVQKSCFLQKKSLWIIEKSSKNEIEVITELKIINVSEELHFMFHKGGIHVGISKKKSSIHSSSSYK